MLNRMGHGAAQLRFGSMLLTIEVATRSPGCICDVSRHEPHVGRRASLCRPVRACIATRLQCQSHIAAGAHGVELRHLRCNRRSSECVDPLPYGLGPYHHSKDAASPMLPITPNTDHAVEATGGGEVRLHEPSS